jgi:hypothetical protein
MKSILNEKLKLKLRLELKLKDDLFQQTFKFKSFSFICFKSKDGLMHL